MKLKSKLLLAASSLLVLSGVAAGTGTYAWFTATQTATVGVDYFSVKTNTSNLTMKTVSGDNVKCNSADDNVAGKTSVTYTATETTDGDNHNKLTDVSSDGINFWKAGGVVDHYTTSSSSSVLSQTIAGATKVTAVYPYCYQITITFTQSDKAYPMAVLLSSKSTITKASGSKEIYKAARVGLVDYTTATEVQKGYFAPNDTINDSYTYISNYSGSTMTYSKVNTLNGVMDSTFVAGTDLTDASTDVTATHAGYLGEITSTSDLTIVIRIWLEGQDSDCIKTNIGDPFNVDLKFYGITNIHTA
jgi:hypothetical protein